MNATEIINELHKEVGIIGGFNSVFTILIMLTILICLFIYIKTENSIVFSVLFITTIILASVFIIELAFDTENSPCKKAINAAEENKFANITIRVMAIILIMWRFVCIIRVILLIHKTEDVLEMKSKSFYENFFVQLYKVVFYGLIFLSLI